MREDRESRDMPAVAGGGRRGGGLRKLLNEVRRGEWEKRRQQRRRQGGDTMDMRQVALGAVFGAAVAVNATLQSLQESESFLVRGPSSDSSNCSISPPFPRSRKRASTNSASSSATEIQNEQAAFFRAFLNDEEIDDGGAFQISESEEQLLALGSSATTPSSDTSAVVYQEDLSGLESESLEAHQRPRKLEIKRKSMEASPRGKNKAECNRKSNDEEDSSTEDSELEWDNSNSLTNLKSSTRRARRSLLIPLLPEMAQSEEAMSAMLQHTTNTVLDTLSDAKERRDQMLENMKRVDLPGGQTTLNLMSRFIDALKSVSDSLQLVHSALFPSSDAPQSRSHASCGT